MCRTLTNKMSHYNVKNPSEESRGSGWVEKCQVHKKCPTFAEPTLEASGFPVQNFKKALKHYLDLEFTEVEQLTKYIEYEESM